MGVKLYYFSKIFVDFTSDFYFAKVSECFVDPSFIDISAVLIPNYAPSWISVFSALDDATISHCPSLFSKQSLVAASAGSSHST